MGKEKQFPLTKDGPRVIFLAPACCVDGEFTGREWCEDNTNWECDCQDAKHLAVTYIRADIVDELREELRMLKGRNDG